MEFIDLAAQQRRLRDLLDENIGRVLAHGRYINGPEVGQLEEELASYVGVRRAVGCSSGTDALILALMALGVGPGDAVFTTPFTFVATAEAICLVGATPIFVDIDRATFNMDAEKLAAAAQEASERHESPPRTSLEIRESLPPPPGERRRIRRRAADRVAAACLPPRPCAVIAVDLFGLPADYDAIHAVARRYGLAVVEDAAQSFGAEYKGRKACSLGRIACTSFFPAKPLGGYGDGGMCFTDDDELADLLRSLSLHGQGENRYDNVRLGMNGRLDTLQAAILLAKFTVFPEELELRQEAARRYDELLADIVQTPFIPPGYRSAWAQYSVLARDAAHRAALMARLKAEGIPTAVYYPKPLHRQKAFSFLGCPPDAFPVSDEMAERIFSLPMHPYLTADQQRRIAAAMRL